MIFKSSKKAFNVEEETIEITIEEKTIKLLFLKKLHNGKLIYNETRIDKREFTDFAEKMLKEET